MYDNINDSNDKILLHNTYDISQKDLYSKEFWNIYPCTQAGFLTFSIILQLFGPASACKNLEFIQIQKIPQIATSHDISLNYQNSNSIAILRYHGISFIFPCIYNEDGTYYIYTGFSPQVIIHHSTLDSLSSPLHIKKNEILPCKYLQHPLPLLPPIPNCDIYLKPIYIIPNMVIRFTASKISLALTEEKDVINTIENHQQEEKKKFIQQAIEYNSFFTVQDCLAYFGQPQGIFELPHSNAHWFIPNHIKKTSINCNCNNKCEDTTNISKTLQIKDGIINHNIYVYNYFLYGFDIIFDGMTHHAIRVVLHTNLPNNQNFLLYHRANFFVGLSTYENLHTIYNNDIDTIVSDQLVSFINFKQTLWDIQQLFGNGKCIYKDTDNTVQEPVPEYIKDTYKVHLNTSTSYIPTSIYYWSEHGMMIEFCALSGCIVTLQLLL